MNVIVILLNRRRNPSLALSRLTVFVFVPLLSAHRLRKNLKIFFQRGRFRSPSIIIVPRWRVHRCGLLLLVMIKLIIILIGVVVLRRFIVRVMRLIILFVLKLIL